ncbi:MAG: HAD family hydrolase [Acutalibacteraceae bacterium]|nr:HAD family hydrolase [Acutalibacteraceae bacterium]
MKNYKYILFDLDGTITDSALGITNSVKYALNKLNAPVPPYETLCKFIGPPLLDGFRDFCGFDSEKAQKAVSFYREYYETTGLFENAVYDGIPELLKALNDNGKSVILATSKPEKFARLILEHFNLSQYFGFAAGASMDETRNNKDAVIDYALKECNIKDKALAVMVGDRHHDIDGAKRNGISCVGVLYGFGNREELETAGADYITEDINALYKILLFGDSPSRYV